MIETSINFSSHIKTIYTNKGHNLHDLQLKQEVLLIFLRHFGCSFCKQTLTTIEKQHHIIEDSGVKIVFVHLMSVPYATQIFTIYDMPNINHITDPAKKLYQLFGLQRGTINQVLGVKNWIPFIVNGLLKGHLIGQAKADPLQMPGVFLIHNNKIKRSFIHPVVSSQPNYLALAGVSTKQSYAQ